MNQAPVEVTKDRLYEEFNVVVAETEKLLKTLAGAGGDKAGALKASVEQGLAEANERIAKIREEAMRQASSAAHATDEYVHENPWQAIGIAAGVAAVGGLVAGLVMARR